MAGAHAAVADRSATARNSVTVAGWTMVSRVTGVARILVIGAVLGPTYFANSFQAGFAVPNLVCTVLAGPVLAVVVVPSVVRALLEAGITSARRVFAGVTGFVLAVSGGLAFMLVVASPLVAWVLTAGVPSDEGRDRAQDLTAVLLLFVAPQGVLYAIAALGAAAQQARGRFALAAAAPAVENVCLIATLCVAGLAFGTGHDVGDVPVGLVVLLGLGSTASVALHAGLQVFGAARAGLALRPRRWRDHAESTATVRRLVRSSSVAWCPALAWLTLLALASTAPGGVFVLQVAYAAHFTVISLSSQAVSTVVLPGLAAAAESGERQRYASMWRQGLAYTLVPSLPLVLLFAVGAGPCAELLARGEANADRVVDELAACLLVVALTQLAGGLHNLGRQALFARLDENGPRLAGAVALIVSVVVGAVAMSFPAGESRLVCLAMALLAAEVAGSIVVLVRLRRALTPEPTLDMPAVRHIGAGLALMAPVVLVGYVAARLGDFGLVGETTVLAGFALTGLVGYVMTLRTRPGTSAVFG